MFGAYNSPYLFGYDQTLRKLFRPRKQVQHQQTCPECERKLVNIYPGFVTENEGTIREKRKLIWKCKRCWDKDGGRPDE